MDKTTLVRVLGKHKAWLKNMGGEQADLCNANLHDADLCWANLSHADLCNADLCNADLHDADLRDANLRGADLRGADLYRVNLRDANLRDADLRWANLRGANLRGADLRRANLRGADLSQKIVQVGPIGSRSDYMVYRVDEDIVQGGCWREYAGRSLADFMAQVDETYPENNKDGAKYRREYLAAIAMFRALREDYLREQGRVAEG